MSTIAEKLKTTYLGLAGLTTSMRQLLSVGAKEVTSQEINSKLDGVAQESTSQEILEEVSGMGAVANELQSGKQAIVDAINHMGGEATEGNTLTDLANKIRDLDVVSNECVLVDDTQKPINIGNVVAMDKIEEIHDNSSTTLREYAFYRAKNLKKVTFEKVTLISSYAFNASGLQEAYFQSATKIDANSLQKTPLRVLYVPIVASTNS